MRARIFGLRNAFRLCNAPATEREFNVSRTALALAVEFSLVLNVAFRVVLRVAFRFVSALVPARLVGALRVTAVRVPVLR
jgi:hypothetical protein